MEIIYKAKREDNGEWITGGSIIRFLDNGGKTVYMPKFNEKCICIHDAESDNILSFDNCIFYKVDPETVCVYTGIKDKDGNRIWENDILDISEEMHSETYQNGKCVSRSNWVNKYRHKVEFTPGSLMNTQRYLAGGNITCKKIGNAVDNPELLEMTVK